MNVDPSHVYTVPCVRMLLALTSVTVLLDASETTDNSTVMDVPVSPVPMEVYVWMQETAAVCDYTGSRYSETLCGTLFLFVD